MGVWDIHDVITYENIEKHKSPLYERLDTDDKNTASQGLYLDRATGRHRDYRNPGGHAPTGACPCEANGSPHELHQ